MAFETLDMLAWSSQQIVVGTVVAVSDPIMQERDGGILPVSIFRLATVAVESRVRGHEAAEVRVLVAGGMVDGCIQEYPSSPDLAVGERVLAFLQELAVQVEGVDASIYGFVGAGQGQWMLAADDALTGHGPALYVTNLRQPLADALQQIHNELIDGPLEATARYDGFMSLDEAPLVEP